MENNWRQKYHLEPERGWLNDPNGLSFFGGYYQIYFQYSPESALGKGKKCWGHWRSKDLLHWVFTGTVLFPDTPEDRSGVYSGCGFVKEDLLYLFYTGNVKEEGDYDYITAGRGANVILVTTKDGHQMSEKKVLLRNADYPKGMSCHVRDPKVWEENGTYRMVLGARSLEDEGCVLYYRSKDLIHWEYEKTESLPDFGYMWECPDVLRFGDQEYLSISPQGLPHEECRNQSVYSSGYFTKDNFFEEWDYGFDFYAPQSFTAPDGRIILIGWMGIGDIPYSNPTVDLGWQHCLTVPREITQGTDGKLLQNPIRELKSLRKDMRSFGSGEVMALRQPFELCAKATGDFEIDFENILTLRQKDGIFSLTFLDAEISGGRTTRNAELAQCHEIQVLVDSSSLEIYLNGGEKVLSSRFYPLKEEITVICHDLSGIVYELSAMEILNALPS
ncbi:MAG: glycoside hydrolase family 32 protein [Lachnospiraceae bacterium]|nr:glycoside hydrolase family 32 protein [Lachnospiraceae bacterium]